ncbi:phytanoyl-CoA dioxygenase family protein [Kitasatospora terrestris]|uniref:DUF1479 family protein n=1 Tax=Kitasatospora terrestris TaxID=258051 RepID=A0ABP9DBF5_9ACTN
MPPVVRGYRAASARNYRSSNAEEYLAPVSLRDLEKTLPLRVLSEEDFGFWQTYGYVVVKEAIPAALAAELLDFAWNFQGMDPRRPETWYPARKHRTKLHRNLYVYGFVEAYHHQLIWESRQSRRVYDAFVDVWDCQELWVTLDRLNLNPPNRGNRSRSLIEQHDTGFDIELHWDVDTTLDELPQRVQGIIALNSSHPDLGGFQCSPELFRHFERWRDEQPADRDPIRPNTDRALFPVVNPALDPGDLLIWNGHLAHGVAPNLSTNGVRAVQYLSMMPALETHKDLRRARIESWRTLRTPRSNRTMVGDSDRPEATRYGTASLTTLGRKLLGLDSWTEAPSPTPTEETR